LNRSKLITPLSSIATSASGNQGTIFIVRTWARYNGWQWPRFTGHFRGVREFGGGFHYTLLYRRGRFASRI